MMGCVVFLFISLRFYLGMCFCYVLDFGFVWIGERERIVMDWRCNLCLFELSGEFFDGRGGDRRLCVSFRLRLKSELGYDLLGGRGSGLCCVDGYLYRLKHKDEYQMYMGGFVNIMEHIIFISIVLIYKSRLGTVQ